MVTGTTPSCQRNRKLSHVIFARRLMASFSALRRLPRLTARGYLVIEQINGLAVEDSPYYQMMRDLGFVRDYRGLALGSGY